jgi:XRE family transcriptional regulator, aerobic/anaerobic benzoate catabolism transcriptional regulator
MIMKTTRKSANSLSGNADSGAYLRRLGERVRTMRSRRGMARKVLAQHARVSERYLAQLESGQGNCSIVLLRRIARSLGLPIEELVYDRPDRPVEAVMVAQFLERLAPAALEEARELLQRRFGGAPGEHKGQRIALIGLRGGGKSTLGRLLAGELRVPFIELDREIETLSGATLSEIFEMFGQERFRQMEREALEKVLQQHDKFVLATSGSIVTEPATYERLLSSCFTIWVRAEPDEHMQRVIAQGDLRPMGEGTRAMADLISILRSREPLYAKADAAIVTSGRTPKQNVQELFALLGNDARAEANAS